MVSELLWGVTEISASKFRIGLIAGSLAAILAVIAGGYWYWYSSSIFSLSYSDEVIQYSVGPGARFRSQVVVRNQGAFSSFDTLVMVFGGNENNSSTVLVCRGRQIVDLKWISTDTLQISAPLDCRRFQNSAPQGVAIRYASPR